MKLALIHPDNQIIGDGYIAWQWAAGNTVIESVWAARENTDAGLPADGYVISVKLPEMRADGDPVYVFADDAAEVVGAAILSAVKWESAWMEYAGTYLRDLLSQPPVETENGDDLVEAG